ncbi:MAG: Xaa-Pro peptidase family protein [Candidatus Bathyarchaeota archaeon]|nr:Xaa-Pro peptidase family protein [Candidatus Bathyarchaeota archaeon]MDH5688533.1 Xaa-Pro peptidase family protein [Candidatus Bathyarchaeota archaeon]
MKDRVEKLRRFLDQEKMDGYLIGNEINIQYFTGFLGGTRLLVPKEGACTLYVPTVNYEAAKEYVRNVEMESIRIGEDVNNKVASQMKRLGFGLIGFDSMDASTYLKLREVMEDAELKPASKLIWSLRRVKDEEEQRCIRKASELTSSGMKRAFEAVKVGLRERELASEIEYAMRRNGSDGTAFDTIVVSGVRSAFPHGGCGDRQIANGDLVVIDIGAKYQGYCSDLTRTIVVGDTSSKQEALYQIVLSAQNKAMRQIKPAVKASIVDAKARDLIQKHGYGEYFVHGLGHGVGLEVHEPPTLKPKSDENLEVGNVLTVEPGVYIPDFGGIRIEDTVLVRKDGYEKLTRAPYSLQV